jgi:ABC-2 type transport system permease protein
MVKNNPIRNIIRKEWRMLSTDTQTIMLVSLIPLLIVGQVILYFWIANNFSGSIADNQFFMNSLEKLRQSLPGAAGLPPAQQFLLLLVSQFNFYLLLIPTMIAVSLATFSIVDEKLSGSLEALLATPVKTWELLLGKALSGAIPAVIVTWICAAIFLIGMAALGWGNLIGMVISPTWFLSLFLLTPAVAVLSFLLGVIGSSRAKDAKSAQNTSLFIILPVLALIALQITGVIWFTPLLTLVLAIVIWIIDALVLRIAVGLFQREAIIVKWR